MKKLIHGIIEFRKSLTDERRRLFAKLSLGQQPDALFIACSDSRVVPDHFASTEPGDLFVLRNIGNLVPPATSCPQENSVVSTLEYSLYFLGISDIIVCGHSECGAIEALVQGVDSDSFPYLASWLHYGKESLNNSIEGVSFDASLSELNKISQVNVLQQMSHVMSYPFIKESKVRIHGWWFDLAKASVHCYESDRGRFVELDEEESELILKRLG